MPRSLLAVAALALAHPAFADPAFRAGAAAVDVTPERFPVAVNCGFTEVSGTAAWDRLHARALVLDDGATRLALVVVDNCMMPREFLDKTKELVRDETKIPTDRQLISATHTHTAPAVMGCLGSDPDPAYAEFLQRQIVRAVRLAVANLAPAKAGWAVADGGAFTNNRQWVLRSDKVRADPFGNLTVRSNMHPGYQHPDFVGPSGPTDPWLSVLSVQSADGKPLAVLANFSMHYFGSAPVSADYFGKFCAKLEERVAAPGFVALLSQGTAGDLHWMDYGKPPTRTTIDQYADAVTEVAWSALKKVEHRSAVPLAMAETTLTLNRRVPNAERLAWAELQLAALDSRKPKTQPEIYAREAVFLHKEPKRELKLQALRVGDLGIAAIPNEVFALTGLKIKARSPLRPTFTVELANGAEGYIPPPEQHALGGYTTWPARTAGLEETAEPKIADAVLGLLEKVSGSKRRGDPDPAADPYAKAVLADKPVAYWRLGELAGPTARDLVGKHDGAYSPGVVFAINGPVAAQFDGQAAVNRAAHFAGGRMTATLSDLGRTYSVELWVWNGLKDTDRPASSIGDLIEIPGAPFREWVHTLFTREGDRVTVYRNGEKAREAGAGPRPAGEFTLTVGGSADGKRHFEGRIAEVAVYNRLLTAADAKARVAAARGAHP